MKNRLKNINFYLTSTSVGSVIDNTSETGSFVVDDVTVGGYQLNDGDKQLFWVVIDANLENNKELFRINEVDLGTKTLYFDKRIGPNGKKTHLAGSLVQINDVAELFNHLSNLVDDFGLAEVDPTGGLNVNVFGGEVRSNGIAATVADTTLTLTDNTPTAYVVFDYVSNTFKEVTTLQSNHALLYETTTSGGEITSFIDKRGLSFGLTTASAIPVFANAAARDAALPSPSDGMQVCLVEEGVYSDYLNGAWISRGNLATPNATETVSGKVEIATQGETDAGTAIGGTSATLAVSPDKFQQSITNRIASEAETIAGSDNVKLITPLRLQQKAATSAEFIAGAATDKFVTPSQLPFTIIPSDTVLSKSVAGAYATTTDYVLKKEMVCTKAGTYRTKYTVRTDSNSTNHGNVTGRLYKNGVALGTETGAVGYIAEATKIEEFTFAVGDLIQIYVKNNDTRYNAYVYNFFVCGDAVLSSFLPTVNL